MNGKFLLLGTNLGDRLSNLKTCIEALREREISIPRYSSIYETEPWGVAEQPSFLNMVLEVHTVLSCLELLKNTQEVETRMGRKRTQKWGARIIDIDILYFDDYVHQSPELTVPHPAIPERRFTILPLVELVETEQHPLLKMTQQELLDNCKDVLACKRTQLVLQ